MNRRKIKENIKVSTKTESTKMTPESSSMIMDLMDDSELHQNQKVDSYCKVDFLPNSAEAEKTFICNRYSDFNTGKFDTEVQTEIIDVKGKIILSQKSLRTRNVTLRSENLSTNQLKHTTIIFLVFDLF